MWSSPGKRHKSTNDSKYYLTNAVLLVQLQDSHDIARPTEDLGLSFKKLVYRVLSKSNWGGYPQQVKNELASNALCALCET